MRHCEGGREEPPTHTCICVRASGWLDAVCPSHTNGVVTVTLPWRDVCVDYCLVLSRVAEHMAMSVLDLQ